MSTTVNQNSRTGKKQKELDYSEKLQLIDAELMSFHQYCQQMGFTSSEMEVICAPLLQTIRKNTFKKLLRFAMCLVIFGFLIYGLSSIGMVAMHFTAVGRIFMIKVITMYYYRTLCFFFEM